ncbi:MAG: hypothetical protein AAEJ57_00825 [Opitutales bacterium]
MCAYLVVSHAAGRRGHLDHTRFLEVREREREWNEKTVVPFIDVSVVSRRDLHRDSKRQFSGAPCEAPRNNFGGDGRAPASARLRLNGLGRPKDGSEH